MKSAMQCDEVQAYLAEHLTVQLADRLSGTVQSYVRTHMLFCPDCCEQLEDFEEMKAMFRGIPIEGGNSVAMRARFDSFMAVEDARAFRASVRRLWPRALSMQAAIVVMAMLVLIAAGFAIRETGKWIANGHSSSSIRQANQPVPSLIPSALPASFSGFLQFTDGSSAAGIPVYAIPAESANKLAEAVSAFHFMPADFESAKSIAMAQLREMQGRTKQPGVEGPIVEGTVTDIMGHYQLQITEPGSYYIAAGFADSPAFYPGVPDIRAAKAVSTSLELNLDSLNFVLSSSPGNTISGRLAAVPGTAMTGASVKIWNSRAVASLLPPRPFQEVKTDSAGSFEIRGVPPGTYAIEARMPGADPVRRDVVVNGRTVYDLQFEFPIANVTGQVLMEGGGGVPEPQLLGEIAMSASGNSNSEVTTIVKFDGNGRFSHSFEAGDYRFRFGVISQDYVIQSITAGASDSMKDTLKVAGNTPVDVEIRVAQRSGAETGIRGTALDLLTNGPSPADRVALCCFTSGGAERISTVIRPDGTFAFIEVPPGRYTAEFLGNTNLVITNPVIDILSAGASGLKLFSTSRLVPIAVSVLTDNGERLPYKPDTSIVFTGNSGNFRVAASPILGNTFQAFVPAGDSYSVAVSNVAPGYTVQSIRDSGKGDLLHGGRVTAPPSNSGSTVRVDITLTKK